MPAIANLVGADWGALGVTPVTHTMLPDKIDSDGVSYYVEAGATPLGNYKASISKRITADNGRIKLIFKLSIPVVATETINGVNYPKLIRTAFAELTLTADSASTIQERGDILQLLRDSCTASDAPWISWVNNQSIY